MSPKTEEQFEEIREARKKQIIQIGMELFANHGFHATSIRQIAKAAGISKGLMYNYFKSKEELLKEIVYEGLNNMMEWFDPNQDGVLTEDEIVVWIDKVFETIKNNTKFWKLYFALFIQPEVYQLFANKFSEMSKPMYNLLMTYFKNAGFPNPLIDAMIFAAIFDGVGFNFILDPDNYPLEEVKKRLIQIFVTPKN